jgi:hypothetical protein
VAEDPDRLPRELYEAYWTGPPPVAWTVLTPEHRARWRRVAQRSRECLSVSEPADEVPVTRACGV